MRRYLWTSGIIIALSLTGIAHAQDTVYFDIQTSTGKDTFYLGVESALIYNFDPNGQVVPAINYPMEFHLSDPNIMGVLQSTNIVPTPAAIEIFELNYFPNLNYWHGDGDDSLFIGFLDGGGDFWPDSAEMWRLTWVPQTTGSFYFDSIVFPPVNSWNAIDDNIVELPFEIINYGHTYTVTYLTGDVNADGVITSADIIYLVNFEFLRGAPPKFCDGLGDPNCNGIVTSADIIYLVSYIFKSGNPPCDITPLIPVIWNCP